MARWYFFYIYLNCTLILLEPQINSGEDILKKAKVESDGQVFSMKTEGRGGKQCFQMQDLPSMLMADKLWMKEIIPTVSQSE